MHVESRDSASLKPAELDELGQLLSTIGVSLGDSELDQQVEQFPLVVQVTLEGDRHGFLFGSLERVGGTPCILWGLGAVRRSRNSNAVLKGLVAELYRRAAISFPDEDVLVAGQVAHPAAYGLLAPLADVVPRVGYSPTGEERAWGRRLARRFTCDSRYDDRTFRCGPIGKSAPILDASTVKAGGKAAVTLLEGMDASRGEALIVFGWALADALADGLTSGA
ncbi:MAG: hypothetical protein JOZ99_04495 [Actinobacteria bacterium]|nr:hypothetical protein [Actinomycetota bacterium]